MLGLNLTTSVTPHNFRRSIFIPGSLEIICRKKNIYIELKEAHPIGFGYTRLPDAGEMLSSIQVMFNNSKTWFLTRYESQPISNLTFTTYCFNTDYGISIGT